MKELEMSKDTYLNFKKLTALIPELQDLCSKINLPYKSQQGKFAKLGKNSQPLFQNFKKSELAELPKAIEEINQYSSPLAKLPNPSINTRAELAKLAGV